MEIINFVCSHCRQLVGPRSICGRGRSLLICQIKCSKTRSLYELTRQHDRQSGVLESETAKGIPLDKGMVTDWESAFCRGGLVWSSLGRVMFCQCLAYVRLHASICY